MSNINNYSFIKAAALEIALDNGMINKSFSEEDFYKGVEACIFADGVYEKDIKALDIWLGSLSKEDQETIAIGEHSEMMELSKGSPKNDEGLPVVSLLDDIFNYDYPIIVTQEARL